MGVDVPKRRRGTAVAGALVALALVASTFYAGHVVTRLRAAGQAVTVKGFAEREVRSDVGVFGVRVVVRAASLGEGYDQLAKARERVVAHLREAGIPDDAIATAALSTQARYRRTDRGYQTNDIEDYELHQRIAVESADVDLVDRVSKGVTALVREGFEVSSESPRYYYTSLDALKIELLGEASRDARVRAERMAEESGAALGPLAHARQGVFQITPVHSTEVSSGGMYDTGSIRKMVRAVVTAGFSLQ